MRKIFVLLITLVLVSSSGCSSGTQNKNVDNQEATVVNLQSQDETNDKTNDDTSLGSTDFEKFSEEIEQEYSDAIESKNDSTTTNEYQNNNDDISEIEYTTEEESSGDESTEQNNDYTPPDSYYPLQGSPFEGEFGSLSDFYSALLENDYTWGEVGAPYHKLPTKIGDTDWTRTTYLDDFTAKFEWNAFYDDITPSDEIIYDIYVWDSEDWTTGGFTIKDLKRYAVKVDSFSNKRTITLKFEPDSRSAVFVIAKDTDTYPHETLGHIAALDCPPTLVPPIPGNNGIINVEYDDLTSPAQIFFTCDVVTNYSEDLYNIYYWIKVYNSSNEVIINNGMTYGVSNKSINFFLFPKGEYRCEVTATVEYGIWPWPGEIQAKYNTTYFTIE